MKLLEVEGEHVPQCPVADDATATERPKGHCSVRSGKFMEGLRVRPFDMLKIYLFWPQ